MSVETPLMAAARPCDDAGRSAGSPLVVDLTVGGSPDARGAAADVVRSRPDLQWWSRSVPAGPASSWLVTAAERLRRDVAGGCYLPTSVHAFGWRAAAVAVAARLTVPVVAHLEDGVPHAVGGRLADGDERLAWAAARTADLVVLDSSWAVDRAVARGLRRCRVVRDLPVSRPVAAATAWTPRPDGERPTVVAVGGVGVVAGTPLVVQALAGIDARLVVAVPPGVPAGSVDLAREWVRRLARSPRAGTGPEGGTGADVAAGSLAVEPFSAALLAGSDLVVDAGTEASSARGVVAAMACRRAVLASDRGSRPELVVAGATGELVDTHSPTAWRAAVARLLQDPFKLEAYGEAGFERCTAGFSPARRADLLHRLDRELSADLPQVA